MHALGRTKRGDSSRRFAIGLARAAGGALLFALPMLLTMEMWWMGVTMRPMQLAALLLALLPTLVGLAYYSGFQKSVSVKGATVDALVVYAVGAVISATILAVLALLRPASMTWDELAGKVIVQMIPASIGAVLASSQMGESEEQGEVAKPTTANAHSSLSCYSREMFLMFAGAVFLALNVAPTEEMVSVALKMSAWHGLVLAALSIVIMHAFVFKLKFHGQEAVPEEYSVTSVFLRFTVPGYAIALLVSMFCLWVFGRTNQTSIDETVMATAVLAMPAAVGAAAARLIL